MNPDSDRLEGWKAVAEHLNKSLRTTQLWADQRGLPVHKFAGGIVAYKSEIADWIERQTAPGGAVKPAPEQRESAGRTLEMSNMVTGDSLQTGPPTTPMYRLVQGSLVRRLWMVLLAIGVISTVTAYLLLPRKHEVSDFRVEHHALIGLDEDGRKVWRYEFPWEVRESIYDQVGRAKHSWLGRLNADQGVRLILSTIPADQNRFGSPVFCFDAKGNRVWRFEPGRTVVDRAGEYMAPPYWSSHLQVIRGKSEAETRIIVSSNHYARDADQVAFLDVNGHIVSEYWHPGHLLELQQADLAGTGRNLLLLGGVNNGNHQATVVVLDPLKVAGVVTPKVMDDHKFELLNMAPANEEAVVFFPRSCISAGEPYTRVAALAVNPDRLIVLVKEGRLEHQPAFLYELDYQLRVIQVMPNDTVQMGAAHRELELRGILDHRFDVLKECERLKAGVVVRRGM